jgi:hypothetical protein
MEAMKKSAIERKLKEDYIPAKIIDGLYLGSVGAAHSLMGL